MLNRAELLGSLGKDPETRNTQNGDKIVHLSLATSERWKDKHSGERKEVTEWHRVVVFGPLADVAAKYLRRGSKCYVSGQIKTRKWQDQSGQDRYSIEIVLSGPKAELKLLDGKKENGGDRTENAQRHSGSYDDLNDEIPF